MSSHWQTFYETQAKPDNYDEQMKLVRSFVQSHLDQKVALISSGGTTVPMEHNTVRFVDNFSAGTRGSVSTEYFLENGYAVVFLYRWKSLEPYSRHLQGSQILDSLDVIQGDVIVKEESKSKLLQIITKYQKVENENRLLRVPFTSLFDYLWFLRGICTELAAFGPKCLLYLAAAVSDFYIPSEQMVEHKIQSGGGPLSITLQLVPKMLVPVTTSWVPHAYVISFKLETDENLLVQKARKALDTYKHKLVIGNMLQTRKSRVVLVTQTEEKEIILSSEELKKGGEIEQRIVEDVIRRHEQYLADR
ncbi:hypothetical protein V9T40_012808 [Parthenolecanium corni]|uniref:DNA/pantothenate metabolism flavoprotein C-terminal domain-containing protein n=1 Tax=Parthenolecanium corni TaxID=536013 RepID=A0AAN9TL14_9HEMI